MPREFSRNQRMAEQIRRDLSEIIRDELKDPRMGFISLTEVRLSKDLGQAIVFCSILEQDKQQETMETLNRAAGFLRSRAAERLRARSVPTLKFIHDNSMEQGAAMEALIHKAIASDVHESDAEQADNNEEGEK